MTSCQRGKWWLSAPRQALRTPHQVKLLPKSPSLSPSSRGGQGLGDEALSESGLISGCFNTFLHPTSSSSLSPLFSRCDAATKLLFSLMMTGWETSSSCRFFLSVIGQQQQQQARTVPMLSQQREAKIHTDFLTLLLYLKKLIVSKLRQIHSWL